jgi:hypothetical protein
MPTQTKIIKGSGEPQLRLAEPFAIGYPNNPHPSSSGFPFPLAPSHVDESTQWFQAIGYD